MPYSMFSATNANSSFYTWATSTALNTTYATVSPLPSTLDKDLNTATWLKPENLAQNINLYAKYLHAKWNAVPTLAPSDGTAIANPVIWSETAEAYLALSREQPWYAAIDDISRLSIQNIITQGEKIRTFTKALSTNPVYMGSLIQLPGAADGFYETSEKRLFAAITRRDKDSLHLW